jgi:hypothetical protein
MEEEILEEATENETKEPQYKTVYQIDFYGAYSGQITLSDLTGDVSPLDGVWLIPAGCVEIEPPEVPAGKSAYFISGEWQLRDISKNELSLEELKSGKWYEIKVKRDRLEQAGVPYLGKVLDSDTVSVQRIAIAVQAAQAAIAANVPFTLAWTMQDNIAVEMDAAQVVGMSVALAQYSDSLHQTARALREQIEAAATAEELEVIAWPVN